MEDKLQLLEKNKTWILVTRPKGRIVIGCKWVFKRKPSIHRVESARFKARLVAKGYS